MKRGGRERRALLVKLTPDAPFVVDVGADHGHVAHALGAVATERQPHRAGRPDVRWVIADGLLPFRRVDVAIIAGMGALSICEILERGPRPQTVVLHCPDDPPRLRRWLAAHGWRIDAEGLAHEAGRFAEVIRAVHGQETATGETLDYGPKLPADPLWGQHVAQLLGHWSDIAAKTANRDPAVYARAQRQVDWLRDQLV